MVGRRNQHRAWHDGFIVLGMAHRHADVSLEDIGKNAVMAANAHV
jgi:hypothetical protein